MVHEPRDNRRGLFSFSFDKVKGLSDCELIKLLFSLPRFIVTPVLVLTLANGSKIQILDKILRQYRMN